MQENTDAKNKIEIKSFYGLKACAMFAIFWWHSLLTNPACDLGARMCEVLFVLSGFLVGINHWGKDFLPDYGFQIHYVKGKFFKAWPIHVLSFLIAFVAMDISGKLDISINTLLNAIINLLLLQAWSLDPFSFNGAAWFLSALLFCYFMAPVLVSRAKSKRIKKCAVSFIMVIAARALLEFLNSKVGWKSISFDYHTSPVIRLLEFYAGILMVPVFLKLNEDLANSRSGGG